MKPKSAVFCALLSVWIFPVGEIHASPRWEELLHPVEKTAPRSGLELIDCIYVINLVERPERWGSVQAEFDSFGLFPTRLDAVNGWKIPRDRFHSLIDPRLLPPDPYWITPGAIGCLLSHLSIYQDAWDRGFDRVWVCEDDIRFVTDPRKLSPLLAELEGIDPDWDLLYTDFTHSGTGLQKHRPEQVPYRVIHEQASSNLFRVHSRFGTHSMIISKRGIEKLLSYFYTRYFWSPIDIDLHYAGLREYSVRKSVTAIFHRFSSDTEPWSGLKPSP